MEKFNKLRFPHWTIPVALLLTCIVSFGILIPSLGFYWDDWEIILVQEVFGPSEFWNYFSGLRPWAAWSFIPLSHVLGARPINWQIFSLLMRWLAIVAMWWSFLKLWPLAKRQVTFAAFLFAIYPLFIQQPIAVTYQRLWLAYAAFLFSLGAMVQSVRVPQRTFLYGGLSVLLMLIHLVTIEYFVGVELLRPVILWLVIQPEGKHQQKVWTVFKKWLPYLLILVAFSGWRIYASTQISLGPDGQMPADSNPPTLLFDLLAQPINTIIQFTEILLQDTVHILFSTWQQTLSPRVIDLQRPFTIFSWGMAGLSVLAIGYYLSHIRWNGKPNDPEQERSGGENWYQEAIPLGFLSILLGMLPVWMIYQQVSVPGNNTDRFGLAAMFGASFFLVGVFEWILKEKKTYIVIAVLVGLSVGLHLRVANEYEFSWTKQIRVYWQLYWRAPSIKPETSFLSDRDLFSFVRPNFAFNVLYMQPEEGYQLPYWFYMIPEGVADGSPSWLDGFELEEEYREFTYQASSKDSLVIFYEPPRTTNCLWVLSPDDYQNPNLTARLRDALPISNLDRIHSTKFDDTYPLQEIFGKEPEHTWCYYYQKAELARQNDDWEQIVSLGKEALSMGFNPGDSQANSPQEWLAFIEGYSHEGHWSEAQEFTMTSFRVESTYHPVLCSLWQKIEQETQDSPEKTQTVDEIFRDLECKEIGIPNN